MEKNKRLLRILVPVLIVVALAVIWAVKTRSGPAPSDGTGDTAQIEADFVLEAASVDLEALTAHGLPIIIDFGSDTCIPCKEMAPVLESMNAEMQGRAIIKFINVGENTRAADGFPVQVIPTQIFINADGTPYAPGDDAQVEFILYAYEDTGEHAFTVHQGKLTEDEMRAILTDMGVTE